MNGPMQESLGSTIRFVDSAQANWTITLPAESWPEVMRRLQESTAAARADGELEADEEDEAVSSAWVRLGGDPGVEWIGALAGHRHPPGFDYHLTLLLSRAPDGEAPESVVRAEEALGGIAGLEAVLDIVAAGVEFVRWTITASLPTADWDCRVLPMAIDEQSGLSALSAMGSGGMVEAIGARFEDPSSEVAISHFSRASRWAIVLRVSGRPALKRPDQVAAIGDAVSRVVQALFTRKAVTS